MSRASENGSMTCKSCNKKLRPGEANEISLQARDANGEIIHLRSIAECKDCLAKIIAENDDILDCAMKAMISSGKESYLATYAKHLEKRLRELEMEMALKLVDMAGIESEIENFKEHVTFLERIIGECGCNKCTALFDQIKTR